jgi:Fic family protein
MTKANRSARRQPLPVQTMHGTSFGYVFTPYILQELQYIDRFAGGLMYDVEHEVAGSKAGYLIRQLMEEAITSSQLEGAATTRAKAREMLLSGTAPKNNADRMVLNNYHTMNDIKTLCNEPLSPQLIKTFHATLTKDTLEDPTASGRFRLPSESIHVVDHRDNEVLHTPPHADVIAKMIRALCDYANNDSTAGYNHPALKAIVLHFWLAYIHPFVDGNGRTARALFYWYMLKKKYWLFEWISISSTILRAPAEYSRAYLYSERDDNDLTYFLVYHLRVIHRSIDAAVKYIANKQAETKTHIGLLHSNLNTRQQDIVRHFIDTPTAMYAIKTVQRMYGVVYQTARTDLFDLANKGFLKKIKKGKAFYFIATPTISKKYLQSA